MTCYGFNTHVWWHLCYNIYTVRTNARPAADINSHSRRALAEKGASCVDALAIDAHPRKHLTLVHIWQIKNKNKNRSSYLHECLNYWVYIGIKADLTFTIISSDSSKAFTTDWVWKGRTRSQCSYMVKLDWDSLKCAKWSILIISPFSHLAQGLFQASPSVAQQWDFSVAPLMLTSQRLLTILSQQVLLVVSVLWNKRCGF